VGLRRRCGLLFQRHAGSSGKGRERTLSKQTRGQK
jgi:hypothetical protein